tara:strand:+ start:615 stop:1421 length:807 start_codon:yes stop_codon:yes gene_type:complete
MSKILLIDAYNMLHRSRFGFGTGEHSITFNFFRSLKSEIDRHAPNKVYVVLEGTPIHRIEKSEGKYKGNREKITDTAFHRQKKDIFKLCELLPVTVIKHPDFECDDVIGTLSEKYASNGSEVVICSSDSDFIQLLVNPLVTLWNPVKKLFVEEWHVDYLTWKSLKGDPTDNVPGIKGVGAKTATKLAENNLLLNEFLDKDPLKREAFESAKSQIKLVNIDLDCHKWFSSTFTFNEKALFSEFKNRDFKTIVGNAWNKWKVTMEKVCNE